MTTADRDRAVAAFAEQITKLAAKHPASGVFRELVRRETAELLRQLAEEAEYGAT